MVGKRRYRPAEGKMLMIPSLPLLLSLHRAVRGRGLHGRDRPDQPHPHRLRALIGQVEKYTKETED